MAQGLGLCRGAGLFNSSAFRPLRRGAMPLTNKGEKAIADLFAILDISKSGEINKAEQEKAKKNIHSMSQPNARWTWSDMDTDGDGKISEREFQEGMQAISDKVGEEQLLDCIIRAWPDHPLALEER